ncbi:MAG: hypothetical protein WKF32_02160 [Thermoleophilaceae bacterium]
MAPESLLFRGDDSPMLVEASLACRVCLSGDVDYALRPELWAAEAECRCVACGERRTVSLTDEQALRLSLHRRA